MGRCCTVADGAGAGDDDFSIGLGGSDGLLDVSGCCAELEGVVVFVGWLDSEEGSDSVVEKEVFRSTREVSKVMFTVSGCVMVDLVLRRGEMEGSSRSSR